MVWGHTRNCDIALRSVQAIKLRTVIPNHEDNFYPPISTYVDIRPFIKGVTRTCPDTTIRIMQINETITILFSVDFLIEIRFINQVYSWLSFPGPDG